MLSDFWIWAILAIAMRLVAMSIGSIWVLAEREKEIVIGSGPDLDQL